MKIIHRREHVECVTYQHGFSYLGQPGSGFSFPCEKDGSLISFELWAPAARDNLAKCLFGGHVVSYDGIETHRHSYSEPAIGKCSCGCEVILDSFTNTCDRCGSDYNMSGQLLADRSQWGEETGESLSDILSI